MHTSTDKEILSGESFNEGRPVRLRDLTFEDLYLAEDGDFNFVGNDGIPVKDFGNTPVPYDEIDFLLAYVRREAANRDEFELDHDSMRYRVAVMPAMQKIWYVMRRALKEVPELRTFEGVGLMWEPLINLGQNPGLIIAAGGTGSGKTTFVSALLKTFLADYGGIAVTIESPPELALEGEYPKGRCMQVSCPEREFQRGLQRALRWRPRFILIGEIRSQEAAMTAIQAAQSGHIVLCTMHAGSIQQALINLVQLAAPHGHSELVWRALAESLNAVIHLNRFAMRQAPYAKVFSLPSMPGTEGVRSKLRTGAVEHLANDIDQMYARMNRRETSGPGTFNRR
mgnify:CR=1 FL=1